MKSLIIGAGGFVGSYLIDCLVKDAEQSICATKMANEKIDRTDILVADLDILDKSSIISLLNNFKPDYIYHLAAQSSVKLSWDNPGLTVDINIKGTLNVLDAIRESNLTPRILLIGSGEEYGHVAPNELPINENNLLRPGNIYAATKCAQNFIGSIYNKAYSMDIMMVRAFNHIGPKQSPIFVVSDFCKQLAEIEKGLREPIIYVGNLSSKRDFTDVRDVVCAYKMLMQKGKSGETYNVGSSKAITMQEILDKLLTLSKTEVKVVIDQSKFRPVDVPVINADITKINKQTGWKPVIPIEQTLLETFNYWKNHL